ncbi:uncharacterized protein YALI1_E11272g [Yarrowia lipolytica]|uniref:Uncharacterized protein n=1 Tax=Yarrowia lipolytica TaxID=4952 RepID=A0A1D8NHQ1_YARLL|nr:hypothetical protein YALI1_E11272g [Yarrowia lipolytica]
MSLGYHHTPGIDSFVADCLKEEQPLSTPFIFRFLNTLDSTWRDPGTQSINKQEYPNPPDSINPQICLSSD